MAEFLHLRAAASTVILLLLSLLDTYASSSEEQWLTTATGLPPAEALPRAVHALAALGHMSEAKRAAMAAARLDPSGWRSYGGKAIPVERLLGAGISE